MESGGVWTNWINYKNKKMNSIEKLDGGMSLTEQERKEYAERINSPFSMEIEDVWELENYPQNPMTVGRVWSGIIKKGDRVVIIDDGKRHEAVVFGIGMFDKILDEAEAGDACGILLQGVGIEELQIGSIIHKVSK